MSKRYVYGVFDKEWNLIYEGDAKDLMRKYNIYTGDVYSYQRDGRKFMGKYYVRKLRELVVEKPVKVVRKRLTKHERTLDYLIRHLQEYGNTVLNEHPDSYINELRQSGYKISYRKVKAVGDEMYRQKKKEYFYILEVK